MSVNPVPRVSVNSKLLVRLAWVLMALAAVGIGVYSAPPYLTGNTQTNRIPLNPAVATHFLWVTLHALPGIVTLIIGPFQFIAAVRQRFPAVHRVLGRVYLLGVLVGGIVSIIAAVVSMSGLAAQIGFLLLAAAWLYSGFMAYSTARRGQFALHRVWMIRNYSLTFAAVLLRVFLIAGLAYMDRNAGVTFKDVYTSSVWASILVSSLVAEWFIVQRTPVPLTGPGAGVPAREAPRHRIPE